MGACIPGLWYAMLAQRSKQDIDLTDFSKPNPQGRPVAPFRPILNIIPLHSNRSHILPDCIHEVIDMPNVNILSHASSTAVDPHCTYA